MTAEGVQKDEIFASKMSLCTNTTLERLFENSLKDISTYVRATDSYWHTVLCPDPVDQQAMFLEGSKSNFPFIRNIATVYPCSLPDPSKCATPAELVEFKIALLQVVRYANFKEKGNPLRYALDGDLVLSVDIASKTRITNFIKKNEVFDDDIGVVDERFTHHYLDVDRANFVKGSRLTLSTHCLSQQIEAGLCEPYVEIVLRSSKEKMVIQRRYTQFFGIISEIGGFNDMIIIVIWVVYAAYNAYAYKRQVRAEILTSLNHSDDQEASERRKNIQGEEEDQGAFKELDSGVASAPELLLLLETSSKSRVMLEMFFSNWP